MAFDYNKLRGRIREIYSTQERFANAMDFAVTSLSFKLNNRVTWTQQEINTACKLLKINDNEMTEYFFKEVVQKTEQVE